ncbi:23S rRNA (pseudouridine(1915)-N(3))-methyltransferase RlmH [Pacificimonas flava]|uniref:Ribosomal RNA large subunit methyltransferase H n=2 Tax=Pacificimonas TaxID=1960290 RepID=A0A219B1J6_9SPHN|nr:MULTISPECIES: 23S rRNA (pseudouridine(1915)-N(3))-methyltransferase RlmH [Pacificimonas]MBZ6378133.1 23S rRNA (pseudouridine(1915)-N(3))-methyltransferase RlmH [Pacificimonas aurantium]OWV32232.1 23S rRNA (pseudouridine(1915)-N(3))-methyltransferase RlmH [Pacificimonas flava]
MRLHIVARGKIGRSAEAELVERYARRCRPPLKLTELPESGGRLPEPSAPVRMVVLDERGTAFGSEALAAKLSAWRDEGVRETQFHIGAADGHPEELRRSADLLLSFGAATWPHLLVRAMLAEQLYRAETIIAGHPYHRAG